MDTPKQSPETPETSGIGIVRDVRQLRAHGEASAAELREFLARTRGRSPQEVLGMVAGSHLTWSIALATVATVLVLAVGTIVPWLLGRATSVGESPAKAAAANPAGTAKTDEADATPQPPTPVASVADVANPRPSPADAEKAVEAMGLGDTKTVDPKSNPLENTLDNLLDNLE